MKRIVVFIVMTLLSTALAMADDYIGWGGAPMYDSGYFINAAGSFAMYTNSIALNNSILKGRKHRQNKIDKKLTLISRATEAKENAHKMAVNFPKEHQEKLELAFNESYQLYLKLESNVGIPKGDVAGAVAGFIIANYEAVNDRKIIVSKNEILTVANQIRVSLASNADFAKASMADKQNMYEQMGTIAAFVTIANNTFKQHPNPEGEKNLHNMASTLLEKFLKMPANKVKINKSGLQFL
jgi:hypothetical protein